MKSVPGAVATGSFPASQAMSASKPGRYRSRYRPHRDQRRRCVRYWCPSERLPFRDFTAEEFLGRTLTIGAGGGFFREAVSLSARWLMRAFMLAGAPTSIRKQSQLNSGHAEAVFVLSKLQLMGSGSEFCDSFAAEVETLLLIKNRRPGPNPPELFKPIYLSSVLCHTLRSPQ